MRHEKSIDIAIQNELDMYHFPVGIDLNICAVTNLIGADGRRRISVWILAITPDGADGDSTPVFADTYNISILLAGKLGGAVRNYIVAPTVTFWKEGFIW